MNLIQYFNSIKSWINSSDSSPLIAVIKQIDRSRVQITDGQYHINIIQQTIGLIPGSIILINNPQTINGNIQCECESLRVSIEPSLYDNTQQLTIPPNCNFIPQGKYLCETTKILLYNILRLLTRFKVKDINDSNADVLEILHNPTNKLTPDQMINLLNDMIYLKTSRLLISGIIGNMIIFDRNNIHNVRRRAIEVICRLNDEFIIERSMYGFLFIQCNERSKNNKNAFGVSAQEIQYILTNLSSPNNLLWISLFCRQALIYELEQNAFVFLSAQEINDIQHINKTIDRKVFSKQHRARFKINEQQIKRSFISCRNFNILSHAFRYIPQFIQFSDKEYYYFLKTLSMHHTISINDIKSGITSNVNMNESEWIKLRNPISLAIECLQIAIKKLYINEQIFHIAYNSNECLITIIKREYEIFMNTSYQYDSIILLCLNAMETIFKKK
eukprot:45484_1